MTPYLILACMSGYLLQYWRTVEREDRYKQMLVEELNELCTKGHIDVDHLNYLIMKIYDTKSLSKKKERA